jgi:hypothetical protein
MFDQFTEELQNGTSMPLTGKFEQCMRTGTCERNAAVRNTIAGWLDSVKQMGATIWLHAVSG